MLALRELQTAFREALLEDNERAIDAMAREISDAGMPARERLAIYRNNVFASLTDVLKQTFPAVVRIVDERFFSYAAHEFIAQHPPGKPSLLEYGGGFPHFLAAFPPARELAYLADVARFEWLMNMTAHAMDAELASVDALTQVAPEDAERLTFRLDPSLGYLASPFPVDAIWRANRSCDSGNAVIDLASGGVWLEVRRRDGDVVFRKLDEAPFAFRQALATDAPLGAALTRALTIDPGFSSSDALGALFAEGAIAAVTLPTLMEPAL
jgi:hypothetical protein